MCRVIFSEYYFKDHIGNKCTLVRFMLGAHLPTDADETV